MLAKNRDLPKKKLVQKMTTTKVVIPASRRKRFRMTYNELKCAGCALKAWPYQISNISQLSDIFPLCRNCTLDRYLAGINW